MWGFILIGAVVLLIVLRFVTRWIRRLALVLDLLIFAGLLFAFFHPLTVGHFIAPWWRITRHAVISASHHDFSLYQHWAQNKETQSLQHAFSPSLGTPGKSP